MDDWVKSTTILATFESSDNIVLISTDIIRVAGGSDPQYNKLIDTIQNGFQKICSLTAPEIREYWEVRHRLSVDHGLVLFNQRIVIPTSQCTKVLQSLHSMHQGKVDMKAHANKYALIRDTRAGCTYCSKTAPSQPKEPINLTPSPDWPANHSLCNGLARVCTMRCSINSPPSPQVGFFFLATLFASQLSADLNNFTNLTTTIKENNHFLCMSKSLKFH